MEITTKQSYAADPAAVHAMFIDPAYLEEVCRRGGAIEQTIAVDGDNTSVRMKVAAPSMAKTFVGDTLTVIQKLSWGPAGADGSRTGSLHLTVDGMPVLMTGNATMKPGAEGTEVTYVSELKVSVPLVGRKMEQQAAPAVTQALTMQQQVGADWLANRA